MRYTRYVGCVNVKELITELYTSNPDFRLLLDDIIYEDWEDIGFDSFINTACDEALWEALDTISNDRELKKAIEEKLFFAEPESADWEVCPAFASEKDFNNWWYGR